MYSKMNIWGPKRLFRLRSRKMFIRRSYVNIYKHNVYCHHCSQFVFISINFNWPVCMHFSFLLSLLYIVALQYSGYHFSVICFIFYISYSSSPPSSPSSISLESLTIWQNDCWLGQSMETGWHGVGASPIANSRWVAVVPRSFCPNAGATVRILAEVLAVQSIHSMCLRQVSFLCNRKNKKKKLTKKYQKLIICFICFEKNSKEHLQRR